MIVCVNDFTCCFCYLFTVVAAVRCFIWFLLSSINVALWFSQFGWINIGERVKFNENSGHKRIRNNNNDNDMNTEYTHSKLTYWNDNNVGEFYFIDSKSSRRLTYSIFIWRSSSFVVSETLFSDTRRILISVDSFIFGSNERANMPITTHDITGSKLWLISSRPDRFHYWIKISIRKFNLNYWKSIQFETNFRTHFLWNKTSCVSTQNDENCYCHWVQFRNLATKYQNV